ncbi:DSS4 Protein DSS4 [Candida maltosa Xu316]
MASDTINNISPEQLKQSILRCPFKECNTRIIPYSESFQTVDIPNPPFDVIKPNTTVPITNKFYKINDVWDFDNIGVSRPDHEGEVTVVDDGDDEIHIERYLICSECDKGPLGFAGIPQSSGDKTDHKNLKYFLSTDSVVYDY